MESLNRHDKARTARRDGQIRHRLKLMLLGSRIAMLLLSFALLASPIRADEVIKAQSDVRVLIDVSGSMKKNDPDNLRIPALQLLTNIMPPENKAGVWTFGKYVNMLVPHKVVDDDWKLIANEKAPTIKSNALHTNIGLALTKAKYNWEGQDETQKRSVLLLTDGVVDIDKDEFVNAQERIRILKEILPELKQAGVNVHTIALSENADLDLLQKLSKDTDGVFHLVKDAAELTPVFLKIFDQATERDSLPLEDNTFDIDKAVDEFTLLVFKKEGAPESILISPKGKELKEKDAGESVAWFADKNFDLITLKNPETGQWKVRADVDPLNRVMVVSDLSLNMERVPNNLLTNESLVFKMSLLQDGELIKRGEFLSLASFGIKLEQDKELITAVEAMDDGKLNDEEAGDGIYTATINTGTQTGRVDVSAVAESPTFKRMRKFQINIYGSPFDLETIQSTTLGLSHQVEIAAKEDVISTEGIKINAEVTMPDGKVLNLEPTDLGSIRKVLRIPVVESGGTYRVKLSASGKTIIKRDFAITLPEYEFVQPDLRPPEPEPTPEPEPAPVEEKPEEPAPEPEKKPEEEPAKEEPKAEPEESSNVLFWAAIALVGNLLIGFLIWFALKLLKKSSGDTLNELANELNGENTDMDQGGAP